ncbi:hypothetical protein HYDPIDRAFT_184182 [Hydnomerulius pinastri MD-312]|uniref:Uncharacterized protein n=1 Tax=Hydnomerulius pinastri MD-312 TaxID=994086 RepID=A0A0C9VLP6_9AGAM|nr:hypothetical protein HYDPIDRAFT_184182 [Hydnomerulius pinastri MD-312]
MPNAVEKTRCSICNGEFSRRGLATHQRACERSARERREDKKLAKELRKAKKQELEQSKAVASSSQPEQQSPEYYLPIDDDLVADPDTPCDLAVAPSQEGGDMPYEVDDIKVAHHPRSGRAQHVHRFSDYKRNQASHKPSLPRDRQPWQPFRSRLDFEIAELALHAALSKDETNQLISLVHRAVSGHETFSLTNHKEVSETWSRTSHRFTPFERTVISVPYRKEEHQFDVHFRPLWNWAIDLLRDPRIGPHAVFDAERLYKYNGSKFVRFFDEPWTADAFWNAQSKLPEGGKPLAFILYSDKTKLSTFGTAKAYPVVARLANLPVHIRNSNGLGGGRVVGWLPIVKETQKDKHKPGFVNFKNVVWHKAFYVLLESIIEYAKTGYWFEGADKVLQLLFPIILILSGDYEEQCVMALIRGLKSKFPCPVCLVQKDQLAQFGTYVSRHTSQSQIVVSTARAERTVEAKEARLKEYSLRDVDNVFWRTPRSDVHGALSWDRLHAHGGLWRDHLWKEFGLIVSDMGRKALATVDDNFDAFPRWRNLAHFSQVMGISYTDGSKHEDISKLLLFAAHPIFNQREHPVGYQLLKCIRAFVDLDSYTALEVHTEETLAAGRAALKAFAELMTNWNFPKMHTNSHVFDDIVLKGVTRNYNTKPNESMHRPLKSYVMALNCCFDQILQIDHWTVISNGMRTELDELDEYEGDEDLREDMNSSTGSAIDSESVHDYSAHVKLGVTQEEQSFRELEESRKSDAAFQNFRVKLNNFLNILLPTSGIQLPGGKRIQLKAEDKVIEHRFLRVNFESLVDWKEHTDYLRCSPSFYNSPRYDCVIVHSDNGPFFARLVLLFTCQVADETYPLALIQPYDMPIGNRTRKDKDLGFWCVRAKPRPSSIFISCRSVIRGAMVVPDFDEPGDYLVVDGVDTDMFLRMNALRKAAGF